MTLKAVVLNMYCSNKIEYNSVAPQENMNYAVFIHIYRATWHIEYGIKTISISIRRYCIITRGARGRPRVQQSVSLFVTRGARGRPRVQQSVDLFVCLSVCDTRVCSPGCHSTAFTAWIAFTQQVISFNNDRFYVKASLSNKS